MPCLVAVWLGLRARAARRPSAFPYFARPILALPRPLLSRRGLVAILAPAPGEHMLEVGPGTGRYTLPVADRLGPRGRLEILDVAQDFLDHTMRRARHQGLQNVVPRLGDGGLLPYPDGSFDAAFLITALGEIADPVAALRELRRVLKPTGRLVVGEIMVDPDFQSLGALVKRARSAGLVLERRSGHPAAYLARFAVGAQE
jgi:ubiquinone/menaquinone biosynthesis C-methylase UbiE